MAATTYYNGTGSISASPPTPTIYTSHAVSRSAELLSCARTSLKLLQQQPNNNNNEWLLSITPQQLHLYNMEDESNNNNSDLQILLEDGLSLLRQLSQHNSTLTSLVRRRGHTNDPTKLIASTVQQFEQDCNELIKDVVPNIVKCATNKQSQYYKHLSYISSWLQSCASQQTLQMKELLKVRGNVLADQAQRRKQLQPQNTTATNSSSRRSSSTKQSAAAAFDSPLFTVTSPAAHQNGGGGTSSSAPNTSTGISSAATHQIAAASTNPYSSAAAAPSQNGAAPSPYVYARSASSTGTSSYYGGVSSGGVYGGGYGGGGYGGGTSAGTNMGMRQRRTTQSNDYSQQQQQIQTFQQQRQTQSRLESAQEAEQKLSHLSQLFGKMSSLISQQAEVIDRMEDDVEAAHVNIAAGQEEITILYSLKKGNRMLIIKVFAVLIFFIIFMRLY